MGQIHNILHRGQLTDALKRAVGATKSEGGVERFGETLTPIIDLWSNPEWQWYRHEIGFYALREQAAVALEFGMIAVTLPAASKDICVIEAIEASIDIANGDIQLIPIARTYAAGTLTLVSPTGHSLDQRTGVSATPGGGTTPAIELWAGSDAVDPGANGIREIQRVATARVNSKFLTLPRTLTAGFGFLIYGGTVNVLIKAAIVGRIRTAYPGELV